MCNTHSLLLGHVRNCPLILHGQHGYLPHLLLLGLLQEVPVPVLGHSGHNLLLVLLVLPLLDAHCVMELLLYLRLLHLMM